MRVIRAAAGTFLLIAIVLISGHGKTALGPYMRGGSLNYNAAVAYWEEEIAAKGPEAARQEYLKQGSQLSEILSHNLAHTFGAALFARLGTAGLGYCGSEFVYGCYHELVGTAISELGMGTADQLYNSCLGLGSDASGCEHGVGHGLVGYLGYSLDNLKQALAICNNFDPTNPRANCIDGSFMEYNLRLMADTKGASSTPRQLTTTNAFSPCDQVDARYRSACIYQLPRWWVSALNPATTLDQRFAMIGDYCAQLAGQDTNSSKTCYAGVGYIVPFFSNLTPAEDKRYCSEIAPDSVDDLLCLSGAALSYSAAQAQYASTMCNTYGFDGPFLSYCKTFITSSRQQSEQIPLPST